MDKYLLVLACSQRKRSNQMAMPAIERYDGVNYRVLQKAMREIHIPSTLVILILSAKYGLIDGYTCIEDYDLRMTKIRALELQDQVSTSLDAYLSQNNYREILINMGMNYRIAISKSKYLQISKNIIY